MANQTLLQPQEIEVFYIIPTLKRCLSIEMKKDGLKQREIANLLGIKDAAVSQYIKEKRGNKIQFKETILNEIKKSSSLIKDKISYLREMQRLLIKVKETKTICDIHKELSDLPEECTPENIGCLGCGENARDGKIYN